MTEPDFEKLKWCGTPLLIQEEECTKEACEICTDKDRCNELSFCIQVEAPNV